MAFEISDNVESVIVVKNIVGLLSVSVLLKYSEISLVSDGVGNVVLCALLFAHGLIIGVEKMLLGKLVVVLGSSVDVTNLLLPNVAVKFGRLCSAVIIDDVFTIVFDTVMLVLCTVKVFNDTTLEFDAAMVVVDDAVAVTPRIRDEIVVLDTAAVAVLDTNTIFEEFISAVKDL